MPKTTTPKTPLQASLAAQLERRKKTTSASVRIVRILSDLDSAARIEVLDLVNAAMYGETPGEVTVQTATISETQMQAGTAQMQG